MSNIPRLGKVDFNSTIVRLKVEMIAGFLEVDVYFNSTIVRLKDGHVNHVDVVEEFQFYDSTIKSSKLRQFCFYLEYFNSTIVRLKE